MIIYDFIYDLLQPDNTFKAAADEINPQACLVSLTTISSYVMYAFPRYRALHIQFLLR